MKKILSFYICLLTSVLAFSQQSDSDEKFEYMAIGHFLFKEFNITLNEPKDNFKIPRYSARFVIKNEIKHPDDYNIYLIKVLNYESSDPKKGDPNYINYDDNGKLFWIKSEDFDDLVKNKYVVKRYHLKTQFAYGASLSIPFKLRPEIDTFNMKITPEFTLDGFIGLKQRLSRYKDIFLYVPIINLGVTALGINENNILKETGNNDQIQDGLVLGRTFTLGFIFEYKSFQIGSIIGWDKAGGEIGKDWIYNDKPWYSFSIGYSFFGKTTGKD